MNKSDIEKKLKSTKIIAPEIDIHRIAENVVIPQKPKKSKLLWTRYKKVFISAIIVIMLVVGLTISANTYVNTPQVELYIDANPSIKLMVTPTNKVTEIVPLSNDAENLFDINKAEDNSLESVSEYVVNVLYNNGYINETDEIYVSTTGKNQKKATKVMDIFQNECKNTTKLNELKINRMEEIQKKTEYENVSPQKMRMINEIVDKKEVQVDKNDLIKMNIKQLKEIKQNKELPNHNLPNDDEKDNENGNGNEIDNRNGNKRENGNGIGNRNNIR